MLTYKSNRLGLKMFFKIMFQVFTTKYVATSIVWSISKTDLPTSAILLNSKSCGKEKGFPSKSKQIMYL